MQQNISNTHKSDSPLSHVRNLLRIKLVSTINITVYHCNNPHTKLSRIPNNQLGNYNKSTALHEKDACVVQVVDRRNTAHAPPRGACHWPVQWLVVGPCRVVPWFIPNLYLSLLILIASLAGIPQVQDGALIVYFAQLLVLCIAGKSG